MVWGGKWYVTNVCVCVCVCVCGTIPPVSWYSYPNCAPQAPQGKRSQWCLQPALTK